MASILKVDTIQDQSGNNIINENADTITIGASGDTITVPTGASLTIPNGGLSGQNYPAFEAYLSADQTISDDTLTKINVNTEVFDTDGCYDNSTNYRFTPTVAGKYFVYWSCFGLAVSNNVINTNAFIYFNGSQYNGAGIAGNAVMSGGSATALAIIDFNGSTDYVEFYLKVDASSGTVRAEADFSGGRTTFAGAYRIGA